MTYQETLDFLFSQLPMYQRVGKAAYKANLDNTLALDNYFGQPHKAYKTIHVAGTNGKGSVSNCLAAVLQSAGYKVGLYTSPHLTDFRERIRVNGEMIPEDEVVSFVAQHSGIIEKVQPSFFEMTVAMAFDYFKRQDIDVALVEVGLGGRLDSTNIITPELSVITNIGLDHTALLGDTKPLIAAEKAGVIKKNVPVVIGETDPEVQQVFQQKAAAEGVPVVFADQQFNILLATMSIDNKQVFQVYKGDVKQWPDLQVGLLGMYQRKNILTVLTACELLNKGNFSISDEAIRQGLAEVQKLTGFGGRWQEIGHNPRIVCDTGHNKDGVQEVVAQIANTPHEKLHMVWGMVSDKDVDAVLNLLPRQAHYYFARASVARSCDENRLKEIAGKYNLVGEAFPDVKKAMAEAKKNAGPNDLIFIGGSTFVVADAL
ncbi:bifunctional folylpolyglutamate synthase/dihydrofolate synthase [Marinilabiliaceae bacterium JC017]|nr:bifunctional folylpolyglutamate synthase/dihydrofolate synthase [Marinilabiliaceae bacterium JC017]